MRTSVLWPQNEGIVVVPHIHLNGHYTFRGAGQVIDLDKIVAELVWG